MPNSAVLQARRVRLYESIRTAHLERARQLEPAAILYRVRRYDFDDSLAAGLEIHHASPLRIVRLLTRSNIAGLEVNEPMLASSLPVTALALVAIGARQLVTGRRTTVVSYVIGNADPVPMMRGRGLKSRVRLALYRVLSRFVWQRLDRVAYGTNGAREVHRAAFPANAHHTETLIPALPAPRDVSGVTKVVDSVVFLGALDNRKGFPLVLEAWPLVREARPDATLTVIGKGPFEQLARDAAAADSSIRVIVDPPRSTIFEHLDESQVLVLPSQASPSWREQVGLPIVEGLASGCSIVTTTETGLASWLSEHGHQVVAPSATAAALAEAIVAQLVAGRTAASVIADLPDTDGRLAADRWMFEGTPA